MSDIYPITDEELDAACAALDNAITGTASLTSCTHAVLGAIQNLRTRDQITEALIRIERGEAKPRTRRPRGDNA
jgi:hypothetical protein